VLQCCGGLNLLYPQTALRFIRLISLKQLHATSALLLFSLAVASLVTGMLSLWFVASVTGTSWYMCAVCPMLILTMLASQVNSAYFSAWHCLDALSNLQDVPKSNPTVFLYFFNHWEFRSQHIYSDAVNTDINAWACFGSLSWYCIRKLLITLQKIWNDLPQPPEARAVQKFHKCVCALTRQEELMNIWFHMTDIL